MTGTSSQSPNGKRLYRSRIDRMISGVCGGFAEYFVIDPTLMRILWIIIGIMGFGIIAYIACLIIMKENPYQDPTQITKRQNTSMIIGIALILVGLSVLSSNLHWNFHWFKPFHLHFFRPWYFDWESFLPIILIVIGIIYIIHIIKKDKLTNKETSERMNNEKKFVRSKTDKMIGGVCGGLAAYFNIDPVLVRLIWVVVTLFSGIIVGILFYIILIIIIPEEINFANTGASTEEKNNVPKMQK